MRLSDKNGFTIIETMLFLGITGLLIVGVLVGTGASISIQRYRDSITSLQSLLQQQFSDVSNVNNGRNSDWTCDSNGAITQQPAGSGISRGQSDCVLLGRLVTTTDTSHSLLIRDVVGYMPSGLASVQNDLDALKQYNIQVSPVTSTTYNVEWDSSLIKSGGNIPAVFSILILQSPLSGIVRTFIDPAAVVPNNNIVSLIKQQALTESAKICVDPNGIFNGNKMAVIVTAGASSASGVETLGDGSGC